MATFVDLLSWDSVNYMKLYKNQKSSEHNGKSSRELECRLWLYLYVYSGSNELWLIQRLIAQTHSYTICFIRPDWGINYFSFKHIITLQNIRIYFYSLHKLLTLFSEKNCATWIVSKLPSVLFSKESFWHFGTKLFSVDV